LGGAREGERDGAAFGGFEARGGEEAPRVNKRRIRCRDEIARERTIHECIRGHPVGEFCVPANDGLDPDGLVAGADHIKVPEASDATLRGVVSPGAAELREEVDEIEAFLGQQTIDQASGHE
jgi:hypothetical protein